MLKRSNGPYWERPQYQQLISNQWDIITIMLGTNDGKDPGNDHHGTDNWQHDCSGAHGVTLDGCSYAKDYGAMVDVIRTLGRSEGKAPKIYAMISPPLMAHGALGINQTVINTVLPHLVPLIARNNSVDGVIDVFGGMGGVANWTDAFPAKCELNSTWAPCAWWCDDQHCGQTHPNNMGY